MEGSHQFLSIGAVGWASREKFRLPQMLVLRVEQCLRSSFWADESPALDDLKARQSIPCRDIADCIKDHLDTGSLDGIVSGTWNWRPRVIITIEISQML